MAGRIQQSRSDEAMMEKCAYLQELDRRITAQLATNAELAQEVRRQQLITDRLFKEATRAAGTVVNAAYLCGLQDRPLQTSGCILAASSAA